MFDLTEKPCPEAVINKDSIDAMGRDKWLIEIATLEDFMAFIGREGRVILDEDTIIIYDSYIE